MKLNSKLIRKKLAANRKKRAKNLAKIFNADGFNANGFDRDGLKDPFLY